MSDPISSAGNNPQPLALGITGNDGIQRSIETRKRRAAERALQTVQLPDGARVYPDVPPGIGWILERPGLPNRYLATKEKALDDWKRLEGRRS